MGDENSDVPDFDLGKPYTWPLEIWLFASVVAIPLAVIMFEDSDIRNSPVHQLIGGIALVELAIGLHLMVYPDVAIIAMDNLTTLLYGVWELLPTIPWEPWHVTTSMGGFVGPLFILNGLRHSGEREP